MSPKKYRYLGKHPWVNFKIDTSADRVARKKI